jgi:radical SAM protein with 4Fe4S-binding SPASM domain
MERRLVEIAWEITDTCNYNCIHCYNPRKRKDLQISEVERVLNEAKEMQVEKIKYGGGEPLLRKDFLDILKKTISMGFDTTFSTNGFIIDSELVKRIKSTGLERIQVSLDGRAETHNMIRQNPQAYDRAINAIRLLAEQGFKVSVATTLMRSNLGQLDCLFETCSELGVNRWRVMKYIPTKRKDLTPTVEEYKQANQQLKQLKQKSAGLDVYVAREFDELCGTEDRYDFQCFGGRTVCSIKANGDVSPCSYFPHLVVGNLKEKSLQELWNSDAMLEFAGEFNGNRDCPHFRFCQGGCKAARFYILRDKGCDPYCWIKSQ